MSRANADEFFARAQHAALTGQIAEAIGLLENAINAHAKHERSLHALASVLASSGQAERSLHIYQRLIALQPDNAKYRNDLGAALIADGNPLEAKKHLTFALGKQRGMPEALLNLARAMRDMGKLVEARSCLEQIALGSAALAWKHKGQIEIAVLLDQSGQTGKATIAYNDVLARNPFEPRALRGLAMCQCATNDHVLKLIDAALKSGELSTANAAQLQRAVGKIHEDMGRYEEAFAAYATAHQRDGAKFDIEAHVTAIDAMIAAFNSDFATRHSASGTQTAKPVFIIGMPRSGTTLVEQICAAHPEVHPLGESNAFQRCLRGHVKGDVGGAEWITNALALRKSTLRDIASAYLAEGHALSGNSQYFTNKTPHNFLFLGPIFAVFPNAFVIHCRRDPRDVCVSCYTQQFSASHAYCNDLEILARYYRSYEKLMAHWQRVFGNRILDISYESLTDNPKFEIERLLSYLKLDWSDACLSPHVNQRIVQTPSSQQVREPINRLAQQRWKKFEKFLGPLQNTLPEAGRPQ